MFSNVQENIDLKQKVSSLESKLEVSVEERKIIEGQMMEMEDTIKKHLGEKSLIKEEIKLLKSEVESKTSIDNLIEGVNQNKIP